MVSQGSWTFQFNQGEGEEEKREKSSEATKLLTPKLHHQVMAGNDLGVFFIPQPFPKEVREILSEKLVICQGILVGRPVTGELSPVELWRHVGSRFSLDMLQSMEFLTSLLCSLPRR